MSEFPGGEALDRALEVAFGGEHGAARLDATLAEYDAIVGEIHDDDSDRELLRLIRADWGLCDATIPDAVDNPGDTWLRRAVRSGALSPEDASAVQRCRAGLWVLWPGEPPVARCQLSGVVARIVDPDVTFAPTDPGTPFGPMAVWDARLRLDEDGAHLCRAPLVFPRSALDVVPPPPRPGSATIGLPRLRASLLWHRRAYRPRAFRIA